MRQKIKRGLYLFLGFLFIALGILGVILPLLPTTPFIIFAAFFFSQSSQRLHAWLLRNRIFGPILYNWETCHCIPRFAKKLSFTMIAIFGSVSVYVLPEIWLQVLSVTLIAYACYFIANIPTCNEETLIKCHKPTTKDKNV